MNLLSIWAYTSPIQETSAWVVLIRKLTLKLLPIDSMFYENGKNRTSSFYPIRAQSQYNSSMMLKPSRGGGGWELIASKIKKWCQSKWKRIDLNNHANGVGQACHIFTWNSLMAGQSYYSIIPWSFMIFMQHYCIFIFLLNSQDTKLNKYIHAPFKMNKWDDDQLAYLTTSKIYPSNYWQPCSIWMCINPQVLINTTQIFVDTGKV